MRNYNVNEYAGVDGANKYVYICVYIYIYVHIYIRYSIMSSTYIILNTCHNENHNRYAGVDEA